MVWGGITTVLVGLTFAAPAALAQMPPAASTTDRTHPFVQHAEQRYRDYLDAEKRGDVAAYKRVRTREMYEGTLENLKKMGKRPSDLGPMLKKVAGRLPDVAQFTFVRSEARGRVARLVYQRDAAPDARLPGARRLSAQQTGGEPLRRRALRRPGSGHSPGRVRTFAAC